MIQQYKATLRKLARIRQMKKNGYGEYVGQLSVIERKLVNEEVKLYYRLKKKYRNVLEMFPEFKGAYGNLLYLLNLIPEIRSFRSTRSFLIYLGLRTRRKSWNREARQTLIEIAYRVAREQGVKFNRRRPNWKLTRKIALTIYQRLRDGGG